MDRDLLTVLSDPQEHFSKRQRIVARYICDNIDTAAFMTAAMLSKSAGVSESTVVRFATELGFFGYPDMRRELQLVLKSRLLKIKRKNSEEFSAVSRVLHTALDESAEALEFATSANDEAEFESIVSSIISAKRVLISGFGNYAAFGIYAEKVLELLRENVFSLTGNKAAKLNRLDEGDLLFALCPADVSEHRVSLLRLAHDRGAKLVVLCAGEHCEEWKLAHHRLISGGAAVTVSLIEAIARAIEISGDVSIGKIKEKLSDICAEYNINEQYEQ